jgi:serine/threonine-protein kinase RsbW
VTDRPSLRVLEEIARTDTIEHIHTLLAELLVDHPIDDMDAMQFELALVEIGANIVEHSRDGGTVTLRLELEVTPAAIEARFIDNGKPARVDLNAVSLPDELAERGRGLAIALNALDELGYRRAEGKNHWRLVRGRST